MKKLVIASNNAGKLKELHALLAPLAWDVIAQGSLGIPEAEEPYHTFLENALAKARHASRISGLPALADDSGLCVAALGGAPGVLSARFAGEPKSDTHNNQLLLEKLANESLRRAWYYCVIVMVRHADDPQPIIADGIWYGEILSAPQGNGGFGYDPLFWLPAYQQSAAELASTEKNKISHRAQAMQTLLEKLQHYAPPEASA